MRFGDSVFVFGVLRRGVDVEVGFAVRLGDSVFVFGVLRRGVDVEVGFAVRFGDSVCASVAGSARRAIQPARLVDPSDGGEQPPIPDGWRRAGWLVLISPRRHGGRGGGP